MKWAKGVSGVGVVTVEGGLEAGGSELKTPSLRNSVLINTVSTGPVPVYCFNRVFTH